MSSREELVQQLLSAGREHSTAVVMFHSAVAAASGLSATESKALEVVERFGPLTPADLARHSGLAPASVTALLDRLERKRVARRLPHPSDGRRSLVELDPGYRARSEQAFGEFVRGIRELADRYDDEQLATVVRFLREAAQRQAESTRLLTGAAAAGEAGDPPAS